MAVGWTGNLLTLPIPRHSSLVPWSIQNCKRRRGLRFSSPAADMDYGPEVTASGCRISEDENKQRTVVSGGEQVSGPSGESAEMDNLKQTDKLMDFELFVG